RLFCHVCTPSVLFFFFKDPATTAIYTLSLHDALPIFRSHRGNERDANPGTDEGLNRFQLGTAKVDRRLQVAPVAEVQHLIAKTRSEEHTSELQSLTNLVCRLLLEKKKPQQYNE